MTGQLSIASVTVAYNAQRVLSKQLDALLGQRRPLQEIIIVNNGSTDETLNLLVKRYAQVTVLDLPVNVGVGGGFSEGLGYAGIKKKHDWIWLLDDDSVPRDDALETLLSASCQTEISMEGTGILAPLLVNPGTKLSYPGLLWRHGWVIPSPEVSGRPVWFVDAVISSGSLVSREVVERVGLPRADFFMDFVDFEYCFRLKRHGYKIAVVRDSHLDHAVGNPRKTTLFGHSSAWAVHPPWREYYMSRNETFVIWSYYPDLRSKFSVLGRLVRHAAAILAFGERKFACLKMILLGFLDGRAGRLGIRFLDDAGTSRPVPQHLRTR